MSLLVKVLCDQCGKKIGAIIEDDGALLYTFPHGRTGGTSTGPGMIYCLTHGWAHDLDGAEVLAKAWQAKKTSKVATHRARCTPRYREPL